MQCLPVVVQELKEIRNLDGCPLLEKLWLQENEISIIQAGGRAKRLDAEAADDSFVRVPIY